MFVIAAGAAPSVANGLIAGVDSIIIVILVIGIIVDSVFSAADRSLRGRWGLT